MSAAEIIEQIKKLTPAERREVRSFLDNEPAVQVVPDEKFKAAAAKVFEQNKELFRKLAQ